MPRNIEQNAQVREARKHQILDAALSVYIRCGYHGADMDVIAEEAKLAKGLIYYYYKTKKELFIELFSLMFTKGLCFSEALIEYTESMDAVEQLIRYTHGLFRANKSNPRMMQFFFRAPFDAYAIFEPDRWNDGAVQSDTHRDDIARIIEKGIAQGLIPSVNAKNTANSFWSVFVANLFEYSKLIQGAQDSSACDDESFGEIIRFCFQGLGIEYSVWYSYIIKIFDNSSEGGPVYEGL